ncbi:MAG: PAS domain S-box protein [Chloroflexi bacterium]|nr:PAS domain S-box protein [Chloroflexota bacterium]
MPADISLAQLYLDIADVMIVAINPDGIVTEINRKGLEILGYSKNQVIGKNWFDNFVPEEARADLWRSFCKLVQGPTTTEYHETPVLVRDGSQRTIAWHTIAVRDSKGNILCTLGSGQDITRRKDLEKELNRYRQRLEEVVAERTAEFARANTRLEMEIAERKRAEQGLLLRAEMIEKAPDPIIVMNPKGDLVYVNEAACRAYGYSRQEFINMNVRKLVLPANLPLVESRLKTALETGRLALDTVHVRKDKSVMPVRIFLSPIKTASGEVILSVNLDISREVRFRSMLEQLPSILWATDADLKLTLVTGTGLADIGLKPGDGVGTALPDFSRTSGLSAELIDAHRRALAGEVVSYTMEHKALGIKRSGRAAPLRDPNGDVMGTIGLAV